MKFFKPPLLPALLLAFFFTDVIANVRAGFFLPDSLHEMTMKFRTMNNLIILPVVINDSVNVNLILDTGCRNLVLFGKKFQKLLNIDLNKEITFSGLGSGAAVKGNLSIDNTVSIESVVGELVPVIVVPEKNLFGKYRDIHGVIGYEIFMKFEIEINSREETITFRPAQGAFPPAGYSKVALSVVDARPVMHSEVIFKKRDPSKCDLMIDTGSSLGLLLKTTDATQFIRNEKPILIGVGFNGNLYGFNMKADKLSLNGFEINAVSADIVESDWHNHASIGMGLLKDYIVVLNYCQSYACFKKIA